MPACTAVRAVRAVDSVSGCNLLLASSQLLLAFYLAVTHRFSSIFVAGVPSQGGRGGGGPLGSGRWRRQPVAGRTRQLCRPSAGGADAGVHAGAHAGSGPQLGG